MAHTPTVPADRAARFVEKADVPAAHQERLQALVAHVGDLAAKAGASDKLQCEFGAEHVALIHDCNQFLRIYKRGDAVGRIELLLPDAAKQALGAQTALEAPQGQVFKLFGWVSVDPSGVDLPVVLDALEAAYERARAGKSV